MTGILLNIDGNVAKLTINRAQKYNALSHEMWQSLLDHCQALSLNKQVKVLVITGAGEKAFCAGADIEELKTNIKNLEQQQLTNALIQKTQVTLEQLPFATIAVINGVCFGGGVGLALACDYRIAAPNAQFAITPAKLGLLYSIDDTRRVLNAVGLARAKELLFFAKPINAEQALSWGMINQLTNHESLEAEVSELIQTLIGNSLISIKGMKKTLAYLSSDLYEESVVRDLFAQAFEQDDFKEGAAAFIEKRKAVFN